MVIEFRQDACQATSSSTAPAPAPSYPTSSTGSFRSGGRKDSPMAPAVSTSGAMRVCNHIGGRRAAAARPRTFLSRNPATGDDLAEIEIAGEDEVERAVSAARAGQTV